MALNNVPYQVWFHSLQATDRPLPGIEQGGFKGYFLSLHPLISSFPAHDALSSVSSPPILGRQLPKCSMNESSAVVRVIHPGLSLCSSLCLESWHPTQGRSAVAQATKFPKGSVQMSPLLPSRQERHSSNDP